MNNNYAIILAGGVGSRFWPISRTANPKQFLDILGTGKTLIQQTYDRFIRFIPKENIYIFTNELYRSMVREQLPQIKESHIIGEPVMRNTAPCIAYACHKIAMLNAEANIIVSPSDHLVMENDVFEADMKQALSMAARNKYLITIGIPPYKIHTQRGYIQFTQKEIEKNLYKVKTITDNPDDEIANAFIESGEFLWATGTYVWSVSSILSALENYLPEMNQIFKEGDSKYNTEGEWQFIQNAYYQCKNTSIDIGLLDRAPNVYVYSGKYTWSDLGTWASVYQKSEKDYMGNAVIPSERVIMYDSTNCMVNVPKEKLVILQGLDDFLIAESNNTLLICRKDQEEKVKQVFNDVKSKYGSEYI